MADAAAAKSAEKTEAVAASADKPAPKPAPRRALDRDFGLESYKYNSWAYDLEEPFTFEDVMNPAFWSTQAQKVMGHDKTKPKGRGDMLLVRELRTGSLRKYLILEIGGGFIKLGEIEAYRPVEVKLDENAPLKVRWNKQKSTHEVVRKADGEVLAGGFQLRDSATDWAKAHLKGNGGRLKPLSPPQHTGPLRRALSFFGASTWQQSSASITRRSASSATTCSPR
jgi:hypothetical protein